MATGILLCMRETIEEYFHLQGFLRQFLKDKNNDLLKVTGINALFGKLDILYMSLTSDKLIVKMGEQQTTMEVDLLDDELITELNTFIKGFIYNITIFNNLNLIEIE